MVEVRQISNGNRLKIERKYKNLRKINSLKVAVGGDPAVEILNAYEEILTTIIIPAR